MGWMCDYKMSAQSPLAWVMLVVGIALKSSIMLMSPLSRLVSTK